LERIRFGVDIGGTKIEIIALEAEGNVLLRQRVVTPRDDYPGVIEAVGSLVDNGERALGLAPRSASVGVGTPGTRSRASGLLRGSNSVCLNGKPILDDLAARLQRPVRLTNDANCFALSEALDGSGEGADVVFGVILGTGVGAGIVVHGRVLDGVNGIAGEWGHNPLPWPHDDERPGPLCFCGRSGCIETFLSGPAFERDHRAGEPLPASAIASHANHGDADATATLDRYADRLARSLGHVINILDPDVIVLGGGMSNIDILYDAVPQRWARWVFSDRVDTRLVRNRHGDSSGVRGAAWLWPA